MSRLAVVRTVFLSMSITCLAADFSFLMVGDWGGESDAIPSNKAETDDATGMGQVATKIDAQFVLALGDNFYSEGVTSANAATRFAATFEKVFTNPGLNVPWYAIAGNHDHRGDITCQVNYTGKGSGRWHYPEPYYKVNRSLPDGKTMEILMVDTVLLVGQSYMDEEDKVVEATGPLDANLAATQWDWIEKTLAASTADYLFIGAHYPIWSVGPHGPVMSTTPMASLAAKYKVSAYLAGHDHILQHVIANGTAHVVSGAGSEAWYPLRHGVPSYAQLKFFVTSKTPQSLAYDGGFAAMTFGTAGAVVTYYGNNGTVLYASDPIAPRAKETIIV